jgi:hypothetical protein
VTALAARWSPATWRFAWINVAGGAAVLASYAWGLAHLGDDAATLWGGVPPWLQPLYQLSMWSAAAGYFPMTLAAATLLEQEPGARRVPSLYSGILACSALWLPLTCAMLEQPSATLWWAIRLDLAVVGLCSVAVLVLLARSRIGSRLRVAGVAGAVAFCVQTALLDAIVWPAYFMAGR